MKQIEMLEKTKRDTISLNESNIKKIMYIILVNKITNVRYFLKNELGVDPVKYNEKMKEIKKENPKYYAYYEKMLEINKENKKEDIKNMILYIGTFLQYKIELEDGSFRDLDLFDVCSLKNKYFDNLNRKDLSLIIDELTKEGLINIGIDIYSVRKLISISFFDNPGSYSRLMHRDEILNTKEKGLFKEEKERLLKFMEDNKIPLNYDNFILGAEKIIKERELGLDLFRLNIDELENNTLVFEGNTLLDILTFIINNKIINIKYFIEKELKMHYSSFNKKLVKFSERYPEIFEMFKNDYENNYNEFSEKASNVLLYIAVLKKYGIELEDGTFRKFDLFDFYNLLTNYFDNISRKDLLKIFEETFKTKYLNTDNYNIDEIRFLINSCLGSKINNYESLDLPISKESIFLIEDDDLDINEKNQLIKYMEDNNIPFTLGNYMFGARKMLSQRFTNNDMFNFNIYLKSSRKKIKRALVK